MRSQNTGSNQIQNLNSYHRTEDGVFRGINSEDKCSNLIQYLNAVSESSDENIMQYLIAVFNAGCIMQYQIVGTKMQGDRLTYS